MRPYYDRPPPVYYAPPPRVYYAPPPAVIIARRLGHTRIGTGAEPGYAAPGGRYAE